jgi:hypothetical protein
MPLHTSTINLTTAEAQALREWVTYLKINRFIIDHYGMPRLPDGLAPVLVRVVEAVVEAPLSVGVSVGHHGCEIARGVEENHP